MFRLFLLIAPAIVSGQDVARWDLAGRWKIYDMNLNVAPDEIQNAVHFQLDLSDTGTFEALNNVPVSVFINNNLVIRNTNKISWSLDSLKSIYAFPISVSIFSKKGVANLSTNLLSPLQESNNRIQINSFTQAITIVAFLIIGILLVLFFTNGVVLAEYFRFFKIFSVRAIDESALTQRITSINNVFVYGFLSVLIATNLTVFKGNHAAGSLSSEWAAILIDVLVLSAGILIAFLIKIIIINFSSYFFKVAGSGPSQFFNFVRLLLGCFSISSIGLLIIFITNGDSAYLRPIIFSISITLLGLFILTTVATLLNKGGLTVFHLFSYICISEIFPALLLLNITIH